jgi:hypothetical protein
VQKISRILLAKSRFVSYYLLVTIDLQSLPEDVESLKELVRAQRALIAAREIEGKRPLIPILS